MAMTEFFWSLLWDEQGREEANIKRAWPDCGDSKKKKRRSAHYGRIFSRRNWALGNLIGGTARGKGAFEIGGHASIGYRAVREDSHRQTP